MKVTRMKGSNKRSGLCRLRLEGEMTIYNAAEIKDNLAGFINDYYEFELDLSAVNEIDSAGIQLLLLFRKKAEQKQCEIELSACSDPVRGLLDLYRLNDWLPSPTESQPKQH